MTDTASAGAAMTEPGMTVPAGSGQIGAGRSVALLLWACDPDDPVRLATPFHFAAAAAAMDAQVEVYFTARSVRLLLPGVASSLYAGSPDDPTHRSIGDYMIDAREHGAVFFACTAALQAQGLSMNDLVPGWARAGGAVRFMDRTLDPQWRTLCF